MHNICPDRASRTRCAGPSQERRYQNETVASLDRLKDLMSSGIVSVGSHCATHSNLLELTRDEAGKEALESREYLSKELGVDTRFLSSPHGAYNSSHVDSTRGVGYERVFSISSALIKSDLREYVLGRVKADPADTPLEFRLKLLGAYRWLPYAFNLKARMKDHAAKYIGI